MLFHTWNPVTGCTKVSRGCENCDAERVAIQFRGRNGYPEDDPFRVTLRPERLKQPSRWKRSRAISVCDMGDLFHEDVPDEFIDRVFSRIAKINRHVYFVLTKRHDRMQRIMLSYQRGALETGRKFPWDNLWLGVSVEDQTTANERIRVLINTPASHRFVTVEPMLGPVDLGQELGYPSIDSCPNGWDAIDWVICGGETGPGARPMHPDWVRSLRDQCREAGVPFFFKQWGEWAPFYLSEDDFEVGDDGTVTYTPSGRAAHAWGPRNGDGELVQEWPERMKR